MQQNKISHRTLQQQEHNQRTPQQPQRPKRAPHSRGKPQQHEVKKDSWCPNPPPLIPQSSNKCSRQSIHTSKNVLKDEISKNTIVGQSDNQESKHRLYKYEFTPKDKEPK